MQITQTQSASTKVLLCEKHDVLEFKMIASTYRIMEVLKDEAHSFIIVH